MSADTIISNPANPQSLNRYSYVLGNPLKYTDPTGHKECADTDNQGNCLTGTQVLTQYIQSKYKKVKFKGRWDEDGLLKVYSALTEINNNGFHGNTDASNAAFGTLTFISVPNGSLGTARGVPAIGRGAYATGIIRLTPNASISTIIHEMGHILDGNLKRINPRVPLHSQEFVDKFNLGSCTASPCEDDNGGWIVAAGTTTNHGELSSSEDFADSFLAVIMYGSQASQHVSQNRVQIITALLQSYTDPVHSPGR